LRSSEGTHRGCFMKILLLEAYFVDSLQP
jgi:hypothetical protein